MHTPVARCGVELASWVDGVEVRQAPYEYYIEISAELRHERPPTWKPVDETGGILR